MKLKASDLGLIIKLADRGVKLAKSFDVTLKRGDLAVPLAECHMNGPTLDLKRLAKFKDGDFGHDIFGIRRNMVEGKMENCFLPRCAKVELSN